MSRPSRTRILDELGRWTTLASGRESFDRIGSGSPLLFLGLGPDIAAAAALTAGHHPVCYLEHPAFVSAMGGGWTSSIPAHWRRIGPDELSSCLGPETTILLYRPNLRLYPSSWVPVWSRCRLAVNRPVPGPRKQEVWLPGTERDLLLPELENAFQGRGFTVRRLPSKNIEQELLDILPSGLPALLLSINFRGLDALGNSFALLREAGVPVAVWCVDNPFHLLSGLRAPFWKECALLVSDSWFVDALRRHGASRVRFLPLAADPERFRPRVDPRCNGIRHRAVFVGRSRFPGKERFFAGCSVPEPLMAEAHGMLRSGTRPDFGWWRERLGPVAVRPEAGPARRIGYGAEQSTRAWRTMVLEAVAATCPLTVFGDPDWAGLLPGSVELLPEVDYYGSLPSIYGNAGVSLNTTSLLLPCGLNQRHFDVWAGGGFLLTDATPGLTLFPRSLTRRVTFNTAAEAASLAERFLQDLTARTEISLAWREEILGNHTYGHRVDEIIDWVYQPVP